MIMTSISRAGGMMLVSACTCLIFSLPAAAEDIDSTTVENEWHPHSTVVMVRTSDIDLSTSAGEHSLETRLRGAVAMACDDALGKSAHPIDSFNCRVAAIHGAHTKANALINRARSTAGSSYPVFASAIAVQIRK